MMLVTWKVNQYSWEYFAKSTRRAVPEQSWKWANIRVRAEADSFYLLWDMIHRAINDFKDKGL